MVKALKVVGTIYIILNLIGCYSGCIDSSVRLYGVSPCSEIRSSVFIGYSIGCYITGRNFNF